MLTEGCREVLITKGHIAYYKGDELIERTCADCKECKPIKEFYNRKNGFAGKQSRCKTCDGERQRNRKTPILKTLDEDVVTGYKKIQLQRGCVAELMNDVVISRTCTQCLVVKDIKNFHNTSDGYAGKDCICKTCKTNYSFRYYIKNRIAYRKRLQDWRKRNSHSTKESMKIRRNKEQKLKNDLTSSQKEALLNIFGHACALSGEEDSVQMDHVIPICLEKVGTTVGNILPLSSKLNYSKGSKNIFTWFEECKERYNLSEEKFIKAIEYLSEQNEMTPKEYRDHVDKCFEDGNGTEAVS